MVNLSYVSLLLGFTDTGLVCPCLYFNKNKFYFLPIANLGHCGKSSAIANSLSAYRSARMLYVITLVTENYESCAGHGKMFLVMIISKKCTFSLQ